jgi:transcriptional regulator with XRE-family HTH domain
MKSEAARLILGARRAAGMKQLDLARRAGIPHSVLSAYEHGRRDPGTKALSRILASAGYRLTVSPAGPDVVRAGRILPQVLDLASAIPHKRRTKLAFPRLSR